MNDDRYPSKLYNWHPQGRRPAGRPRKRWRDGVADAIRRRGGDIDDVERGDLCRDRSAWRGFINDRALLP